MAKAQRVAQRAMLSLQPALWSPPLSRHDEVSLTKCSWRISTSPAGCLPAPAQLTRALASSVGCRCVMPSFSITSASFAAVHNEAPAKPPRPKVLRRQFTTEDRSSNSSHMSDKMPSIFSSWETPSRDDGRTHEGMISGCAMVSVRYALRRCDTKSTSWCCCLSSPTVGPAPTPTPAGAAASPPAGSASPMPSPASRPKVGAEDFGETGDAGVDCAHHGASAEMSANEKSAISK
mmetsp:Transcript_93614/g.268350  ORF Transcript_93614/g.268350 Transcript_93614/m.268350 type:complete len:234 (+) Transcript_93614:410-1111(+)